MKIEIKNRYNGKVIYSLDCENNTIKKTLESASVKCVDLSFADLSGADLLFAKLSFAKLSGAKLSGANLSFADLSDADLSDADLSDAKLSFAIGNEKEVRSAQAGEYRIVWNSEKIWIGCECHDVNNWCEDSEKHKNKLSEYYKKWRKKNKDWIIAMIKANPATISKKVEL